MLLCRVVSHMCELSLNVSVRLKNMINFIIKVGVKAEEVTDGDVFDGPEPCSEDQQREHPESNFYIITSKAYSKAFYHYIKGLQ